jgi:hypothetical protein
MLDGHTAGVDNGRLSPDGNWWWDGQRWVPARPVDPRYRWDGSVSRRRRRSWPWLLAGAMALLLVLGVWAGAAGGQASRSRAGVAGGGSAAAPAADAAQRTCAPQPCASDDAGLSVSASDVQYDAAPGRPFDHPEPGNVLVTVSVTFANAASAEQHADPFNFVLQDGGGVKHPVRWTTFCPLWTGVNVTAGASYGPKCLAFEAVAGRPQPLTLVWTPALFGQDHPIRLS